MNCCQRFLNLLLILLFTLVNSHQFPSKIFNIGKFYLILTKRLEFRHAIDEWNSKHAKELDFSIELVNPSDSKSNADIRFCDIAQRNIVALYLPFSGGMHDGHPSEYKYESADYRTLLSMEWIITENTYLILDNQFVLKIGPKAGILSRALVQLILRMMWNSFTLVYKHPDDLANLLPLFGLWRSSSGSRVSFRILQLPIETHSSRYSMFLNYVREQLRHTNMVIHTDDLGTVHSILTQANRLNMTESRHSYLISNMDLRLLEDFLGSEFHSNITGFQFVRHTPLIKLDLSLAMEAVGIIGSALVALRQRQLEPRAQQLLCDADDQWIDGMLVLEQMRKLRKLGITYSSFDIEKGARVRREDSSLTGITRMPNGTFSEIGKWNDINKSWTFDNRYEERNKWRFKIGERGLPDLRGEKLRAVVYLEEPFVMRKFQTSFSSNSKSLRKQTTTIRSSTLNILQQQRGWPAGENRPSFEEIDDEEIEDDTLIYEGFCIDLLREMAKLLNFTYDLVEVDDGAYGVEDEYGHWNGIIGVLQRHEADLSVSALTITYSRVSVVDFTLPFMHLGIAILLRRGMGTDDAERISAPGANFFTFMEPLSLSVWMALSIAYIGVASTMWLLAKCSPYEWQELYDDVCKIDERRKCWRRDGSRRHDPQVVQSKVASKSAEQPTPNNNIFDKFLRQQRKNQFSLLNSLWFAVGSLMQQVERMSTPVERTLSNGSTMEFFRESKIPIYERMWSIMQSTSPSVFVNSSREGISRVRAGNYAYLMESTMLEYWIGEDCQLQTIGGLLDSKGYGIALPKSSPLRDIFSQLVAIGEFFVESRRCQSLRLGLCLPGRLINWYFGMGDNSYDQNTGPHTSTVLRFKGSQLYLDNVPTIVDNGNDKYFLRSPLLLDLSDNSDCRMKTETGTGKTRLSDSTFGSDSSLSSNALHEGKQEEKDIIASYHSASSLDEMDDSLCSLKQSNRFKHHSNCHTVTGQQKIILNDKFNYEQSPSFQIRRQNSLVENDEICNSFILNNSNLFSNFPAPKSLSPSRRKISEPAAPLSQIPPSLPQRKNSIRNVFYKMSRTPSIVIGADAHNLLSLQHLIPPTDERLLNRRQSSQDKFPSPSAAQKMS
uniref:Lig_chan-Glu_bd domain-containing protein n=1 Tax=Meloidogyne hapla TaxID=6305 RepID=A0A1I8BPI3_MELHA